MKILPSNCFRHNHTGFWIYPSEFLELHVLSLTQPYVIPKAKNQAISDHLFLDLAFRNLGKRQLVYDVRFVRSVCKSAINCFRWSRTRLLKQLARYADAAYIGKTSIDIIGACSGLATMKTVDKNSHQSKCRYKA